MKTFSMNAIMFYMCFFSLFTLTLSTGVCKANAQIYAIANNNNIYIWFTVAAVLCYAVNQWSPKRHGWCGWQKSVFWVGYNYLEYFTLLMISAVWTSDTVQHSIVQTTAMLLVISVPPLRAAAYAIEDLALWPRWALTAAGVLTSFVIAYATRGKCNIVLSAVACLTHVIGSILRIYFLYYRNGDPNKFYMHKKMVYKKLAEFLLYHRKNLDVHVFDYWLGHHHRFYSELNGINYIQSQISWNILRLKNIICNKMYHCEVTDPKTNEIVWKTACDDDGALMNWLYCKNSERLCCWPDEYKNELINGAKQISKLRLFTCDIAATSRYWMAVGMLTRKIQRLWTGYLLEAKESGYPKEIMNNDAMHAARGILLSNNIIKGIYNSQSIQYKQNVENADKNVENAETTGMLVALASARALALDRLRVSPRRRIVWLSVAYLAGALAAVGLAIQQQAATTDVLTDFYVAVTYVVIFLVIIEITSTIWYLFIGPINYTMQLGIEMFTDNKNTMSKPPIAMLVWCWNAVAIKNSLVDNCKQILRKIILCNRKDDVCFYAWKTMTNGKHFVMAESQINETRAIACTALALNIVQMQNFIEVCTVVNIHSDQAATVLGMKVISEGGAKGAIEHMLFAMAALKATALSVSNLESYCCVSNECIKTEWEEWVKLLTQLHLGILRNDTATIRGSYINKEGLNDIYKITKIINIEEMLQNATDGSTLVSLLIEHIHKHAFPHESGTYKVLDAEGLWHKFYVIEQISLGKWSNGQPIEIEQCRAWVSKLRSLTVANIWLESIIEDAHETIKTSRSERDFLQHAHMSLLAMSGINKASDVEMKIMKRFTHRQQTFEEANVKAEHWPNLTQTQITREILNAHNERMKEIDDWTESHDCEICKNINSLDMFTTNVYFGWEKNSLQWNTDTHKWSPWNTDTHSPLTNI